MLCRARSDTSRDGPVMLNGLRFRPIWCNMGKNWALSRNIKVIFAISSDIMVILVVPGPLIVGPGLIKAVPGQLRDKTDQLKLCRVHVVAISCTKKNIDR